MCPWLISRARNDMLKDLGRSSAPRAYRVRNKYRAAGPQMLPRIADC